MNGIGLVWSGHGVENTGFNRNPTSDIHGHGLILNSTIIT